ncbi:MAG: hypothetical protein methR_P1752 [Methyloprofundus sp.]|nr:MAG: hypothetical protein methR_P1752 [Methyloprofundus sp.]
MVDRQYIIDKSIKLENVLCMLITRYYFPVPEGINLKFMHNVLCDPSANTSFKINVFSKCYPEVEKKHIEYMRRIFAIRNLFAHVGLQVATSAADPEAGEKKYLHPKDKDKFLDFAGAPCYFTKFRDSCHLNSFTYAADRRCPERPASATTTHKAASSLLPQMAGRLFVMQFLPPSRAIAHFGLANCPVAYQGLKKEFDQQYMECDGALAKLLDKSGVELVEAQ